MPPDGVSPTASAAHTSPLPVCVAVQDSRRLIREGLAALLVAEADIDVAGAFPDAQSIPGHVDVVVVRAGEEPPEPGAVPRWFEFRDRGSVADIVQAVRDPRRDRRAGRLTRREEEVIERLAAGLSAVEVGSVLGISPKSVQNHKQRIFGKLGVQSQAHAVATAAAVGLLDTSRAVR